MVNDCLKRGKDIERGGARYNWTMPSFVGMANLVDSLYAIKTLVFDEKKLTLCEFKSILDNNFNDNEALRLQILNRISKYGNDINEIDQYFGIISEHIAKECEKYSGLHSNSNLIPSVFCWVMHEKFGRETSATPDGRKAGFPLRCPTLSAQTITACQSSTAALRFARCITHRVRSQPHLLLS